jgi:predicted nucleic acid-binding protein
MAGQKGSIRLVIDTNIIIASLLKDHSYIGQLIRRPEFSLFYPEYGLEELNRYGDYIIGKRERSGQINTYSYMIEYLFECITVIPQPLYEDRIPSAFLIMKDIDEKDTPFLALAMQLQCPIWSDDSHLSRQHVVPCYQTRDIPLLFKN